MITTAVTGSKLSVFEQAFLSCPAAIVGAHQQLWHVNQPNNSTVSSSL
jgi:hypothetical protein